MLGLFQASIRAEVNMAPVLSAVHVNTPATVQRDVDSRHSWVHVNLDSTGADPDVSS